MNWVGCTPTTPGRCPRSAGVIGANDAAICPATASYEGGRRLSQCWTALDQNPIALGPVCGIRARRLALWGACKITSDPRRDDH